MTTTPAPLALVTGSTGLLGAAIAQRLTTDGYTVIGHSRAQCDLSNPTEIARTLEAVQQRGTLAIAVHAAWPQLERKKLLDTTLDDINRQCDVGVRGSMLLLTALGRLMRTQASGVLIGITTAALDATATARMGAYLPAKYALHGTLRVLAHELAPTVRVHEVRPDFIAGGMNKDIPPRMLEFMQETSTTGRLTTVSDVADVVAQLYTPTTAPHESCCISITAGVVGPLDTNW